MTAPNQARSTRNVEKNLDTWTLARALTVVTSGAVMALSAWCWGRPGLAAAATGAALSTVNVWVLARFVSRATARAAAGAPATATTQLTAALGAKTVLLLSLVWLAVRGAHLATGPLALGLLVSVFSLVGAGLWTALRAGSAAPKPVVE